MVGRARWLARPFETPGLKAGALSHVWSLKAPGYITGVRSKKPGLGNAGRMTRHPPPPDSFAEKAVPAE